ncbi:MAG: hypothetical protein JSS99_02340 [Actinobacteria bacterium]|nr:hypothetical protein [Actinomycetota bacterium]
MRTRSRLLLTALAAALVMATAIDVASAGHFSSSEQRYRATWGSLEFGGYTATIRCMATMEGSFHYRSFAKTPEALVGYVTQATIRHPCTGGEVWFYNGVEVLEGTTLSNSLPWHIRYESFEGVLPNITVITDRLVGVRFLAKGEFLGLTIRCNYTTTATEVAKSVLGREILRAVRELVIDGRIRSETGGCPTITMLGSGPFTTPGGARVTITLI